MAAKSPAERISSTVTLQICLVSKLSECRRPPPPAAAPARTPVQRARDYALPDTPSTHEEKGRAFPARFAEKDLGIRR
jgi:hypothetical protein